MKLLNRNNEIVDTRAVWAVGPLVIVADTVYLVIEPDGAARRNANLVVLALSAKYIECVFCLSRQRDPRVRHGSFTPASSSTTTTRENSHVMSVARYSSVNPCHARHHRD